MEFSKVLVSRPEFKDLQKGLMSSHLHAEVILIDRSTTAVPQIYQLRSDSNLSFCNPSLIREEFNFLHCDAFINIGDLLETDSAKKTLTLTNSTLVTYKYLIVFSGHEYPLVLTTALHTLKNALLLEAFHIKDKIPQDGLWHEEASSHSFSIPSIDPKNIDRVVHTRMVQSPDLSIGLCSAKSLCQIKL